MTISGLTIFKLLPGGKKAPESNCKECGFPTCMAFAMKLAKGDATLDQCKHVTQELIDLLEAQGGKKQDLIKFGPLSTPVDVGGENVIYRHDKTFVTPTLLSIQFKTSQSYDYFKNTISEVVSYQVERVGEVLKVDSITINNDNNDTEMFNKMIDHLYNNDYTSKLSIILISNKLSDLQDLYNKLKDNHKPLLYLKNGDFGNYKSLSDSTGCPIVIEEKQIDDLANLAAKLDTAKVNQLVLAEPGKSHESVIETLTLIRRSIITNNVKTLRFPILAFASDYCTAADEMEEGLWAGILISKYANIVILDNFNPAILYALFTLRQNLFTDPQKPLQIEPKIYEIGDVTENSPVIVTTNFALTYFSVAGEIEASNTPCYLLITPSDGMSVLTAWAANKFSGEVIAKAVKEFGLENKINHKRLIISGYVSMLKEEIEEELVGWQVDVAPLEAVEIPEYLKNYSCCRFL